MDRRDLQALEHLSAAVLGEPEWQPHESDRADPDREERTERRPDHIALVVDQSDHDEHDHRHQYGKEDHVHASQREPKLRPEKGRKGTHRIPPTRLKYDSSRL